MNYISLKKNYLQNLRYFQITNIDRYINLENLIYCINYTLLKNNHIILTLINLIYYFLFDLTKKQIVKFFSTLHGTMTNLVEQNRSHSSKVTVARHILHYFPTRPHIIYHGTSKVTYN